MGTKTTNSKKIDGYFHTTNYDENGRHSFEWDPITGDVVRDHSVSKEDQDKKVNWPNSNLWDE